MIIYPSNWRQFGVPITIEMIDKAIRDVISEIPSINLSFSGGVDSCLLLYYLLETKGKVWCFTVANSTDHPDLEYSRKAISWFEERYSVRIDHEVNVRLRPCLEGDELVKAFYSSLWLSSSVRDIIAGDCFDELNCGYYAHQDLREETYCDYLHRVQAEHLIPLDANSGDVKVYIPYADDRVANLLYRVPLYEKVSPTQRKMVVTRLAEGKVPDFVIERKKYGFATSVAAKAKV